MSQKTRAYCNLLEKQKKNFNKNMSESEYNDIYNKVYDLSLIKDMAYYIKMLNKLLCSEAYFTQLISTMPNYNELNDIRPLCETKLDEIREKIKCLKISHESIILKATCHDNFIASLNLHYGNCINLQSLIINKYNNHLIKLTNDNPLLMDHIINIKNNLNINI